MMTKEDDGEAGKRRPILIGNKSTGVLKTIYELLCCKPCNRKGGFIFYDVKRSSNIFM
jgi:hypothetical protein